MRRSFPGFSEKYGLHPWQIAGDGHEALTFGEIDEYVRQAKQQAKQQRATVAKRRR